MRNPRILSDDGPEPTALDDDGVAALRAELRERGFYRRSMLSILPAWLLHLGLCLGGLLVVARAGLSPLGAAGMIASALGTVGLGTLGHTGSHNAASDAPLWNRALFFVNYPLLLGVSARYWHWSHIQVHHPAPNVVGVDLDCDLRPMFAVNEEHQRGRGALTRLYYRYQALWFPLALLFNGTNIQRQGVTRLISELRSPVLRRRGGPPIALDAACLMLHVTLFLGLPMIWCSPSAVIGAWLFRASLTGVGLFAILAPGHFPADARCLRADQRDAVDFYLRQAVATVNFRTGFLGRLLCSGLEYQIEHHFFPGISHVHYEAMSPLVKEFCGRRGLPYHRLGWARALIESYRVLATPKPVHADVESLRLPAAVAHADVVTPGPPLRTAPRRAPAAGRPGRTR